MSQVRRLTPGRATDQPKSHSRCLVEPGLDPSTGRGLTPAGSTTRPCCSQASGFQTLVHMRATLMLNCWDPGVCDEVRRGAFYMFIIIIVIILI